MVHRRKEPRREKATSVTNVASVQEFYLDSFRDAQKDLFANGKNWLSRLRTQAIADFSSVGFPTTQLEEWKYTPTHSILSVPFCLSSTVPSGYSEVVTKTGLDLNGLKKIVFLKGKYSRRLSTPSGFPQGILVKSLSDAIKENGDLIRDRLGADSDSGQNGFSLLNTAFFQDGLFLHLSRGSTIQEPLYLVFSQSIDEKNVVFYPRTLIVLEDGASVTLVECSIGNGNYFNNSVSQIFLGERASLTHIKLQIEGEDACHIASLKVHQKARSIFASHYVSFGGRLVRNEITAQLEGEYCNTTLNGLFVANRNQHMDNQTLVDHQKPFGTSRQLYKGILGDSATGVFNGRIQVKRNAQKTDAVQSSKNLLLSELATINTKPHLEIYSDDVKCNHGAAIGRLDGEAMFYLQSRGIPEEAARTMLTSAFASEAIDQVPRAELHSFIKRQLSFSLERGRGHHAD